MINGRVIDSEAGSAGVEGAWRAFAENRGNAFVTPEWFWANLAGREPQIVVVGNPKDTLGLLPLVRDRRLGRDVLRFGGHDLGDRFHPAAYAEMESEVALGAFELLRMAGWSRGVVLDKCDGHSGWLSCAQDAEAWAKLGAGLYVSEQSQLPRIQLEGRDWDGYLASRSSNLRQRLRRMERKLIREHSMMIRATTAADLDTDFATLFRLHDARRAERGGTSLDSEAKREALRKFCGAALEKGWLRLRIMECDGESVAGFLGWRLGGIYSFYQSGFAPEWGRLSVGLVMLGSMVREAIDEGAEIFDLLLGEEEYKLRFADSSCEVVSGFLGKRLSVGASLAMTEGRARSARDRIRELRQRGSW